MSLLKGLKKSIKKWKKQYYNSYIYYSYYHSKIDEKAVYVQSRGGDDLTGNMLRMVEELSTGKYGDYKIYLFAKKGTVAKIKELEKNYNLKIHKITTSKITATKYLECAKYILTDGGIMNRYVKREGQIFVDTWHGTPLKVMGVENVPEEHHIANVQHPFMCSDYLIYPNDYMKEKMLKAYMIDKIYPGKILLEGYPRNSVFFDKKRKEELKSKFNISDKEIFVYMPTYRGVFYERKDQEQKDIVAEYLREIDESLNDNQLLYAKLHPNNHKKINFKKFKHIKAFPKGYETYDILNMANCLITDYSSVFFDYANTKEKIIIFNYDEEEYLKDRELYFPLSELPFPKVQTVEDLIREMNSPKNYDDSEFLEKYCTYDRANSTEYLCKHIFNGEKVCKEEEIQNDKKNILIYGGSMKNNGITSALLNLLQNVDTEKYNFFLSFRPWEEYVKKNHEEIYKSIPEGIQIFPLRTRLKPTYSEKKLLKELKDYDKKIEYPEKLKRLFKRELERYYYNAPFDTVIDFDGYGLEQTLLFSYYKKNSAIWVHSNMVREMELRGNQSETALKEAYSNHNIIGVVSPGLIEPTSKISGSTDKIKVVHNFNNDVKIKSDAEEEIFIDKDTLINTNNPEGIEGVLNSKGKKFITIGRFSLEKGHERLLCAFDEFCDEYPDTQLIIIGGMGGYYPKTKRIRKVLKHWKNVTLIKAIPNPMPILKRCDLFILSSFYEGWPVVIMESATLELPVISTSIPGLEWIEDSNGHLVENSKEGLLQGMQDYMKGKVKPMQIDSDKYNENAKNEFYSILE